MLKINVNTSSDAALLCFHWVLQGHVITKVEAIDGDRGKPRRIKYGLVSENRPFTVLFEIGLFSGTYKL